MKWSFASIGLIILGLFGIIIIMLFNDITVSNEQDYYTLKYATEAAMIESVDTAYYRLTGKIKMSQEKFVENFTRRFTETSTFGQGNYNIVFYQIIEYPAKVSLGIYDRTGDYNIYTYNSDVEKTSTNIVNELSAILDTEEIKLVKAPKVTPTATPTPTPKPIYRNRINKIAIPRSNDSGCGDDNSTNNPGGCGSNCCLCGGCGGGQCSDPGNVPPLEVNPGNGNWGLDGNGVCHGSGC